MLYSLHSNNFSEPGDVTSLNDIKINDGSINDSSLQSLDFNDVMITMVLFPCRKTAYDCFTA